MAGFILVCPRDRDAAQRMADSLRRCALRLSPDTITPAAPDLLVTDGVARVVVNPVPGVRATARGVCLGALFEDAGWSTVGGDTPDGTYAVVRHDERYVELLTDTFGSRTIWYAHTDETFLAATSQRALVMLLGGFEPDPEAVTWLLAAGNMGPHSSWDRRLTRVPSATRVRLDRETWTLATGTTHLTYAAESRPPDEHLGRLRDAIFAVCSRLDVESRPTTLTLSGGCDSRSLLVGLAAAGKSVTCVTWGLAASLDDPLNDAAIARRVARLHGMPHEYLLLDEADAPIRNVLTRFLSAGEGRLEDFSGYTDGFAAWRHLFERGLTTILRGDCPGWGSPYPPIDDDVARAINMHCTLVSDYPEGHPIHDLGLALQRLPEALSRRESETLDQYRDRVYNEYELPTCMAAMNDVKCAYGEVVNPLLGRDVVAVTVRLPDELRHCRVGFERLATGFVPGVPFAERGADAPPSSYLARPDLRAELTDELSSQAARQVLSPAACDAVLSLLDRPLGEAATSLRRRMKAVVPQRLVRAVRPAPRPRLEAWPLAFRAYLASRTSAILRSDAEALPHGHVAGYDR